MVGGVLARSLDVDPECAQSVHDHARFCQHAQPARPRAADPLSTVLRQAGSSTAELIDLDIPWLARQGMP
jgi:hypothetical protein